MQYGSSVELNPTPRPTEVNVGLLAKVQGVQLPSLTLVLSLPVLLIASKPCSLLQSWQPTSAGILQNSLFSRKAFLNHSLVFDAWNGPFSYLPLYKTYIF